MGLLAVLIAVDTASFWVLPARFAFAMLDPKVFLLVAIRFSGKGESRSPRPIQITG
jgi:hypothetical protein